MLKFVTTINDHVLAALDIELGEILVETLDEVIESLLVKQRKGMDVKFVLEPHLYDIFKMAFRALSVFQSFKLQGKVEPDNIRASKTLIKNLFDKMTEICPNEDSLKAQELSYLDHALPKLVRESFCGKTEKDFSMLSLQSPTWRLYFAIMEFLDEKKL